MLVYLGRVAPFKDDYVNKQEMANEFSILLATYPLLTFTEWVPDMESQMLMGWVLIAIICLNVIFNMILLLWIFVCQTYWSCRRRYVLLTRKRDALEMAKKRKLYLECIKESMAPEATPRSFNLKPI